jgi:hypothetical protein
MTILDNRFDVNDPAASVDQAFIASDKQPPTIVYHFSSALAYY